ncbi:MAG: exodeoxyribonuclease V subunit alpha [Myxococcales bacterium]|nr:exodeoxyribonuclease V subunit alpha [Myxococcales bacterium]HIK84907.1 exodeoxyribonuclease V subunit alpha [Myxococcales bacterium]
MSESGEEMRDWSPMTGVSLLDTGRLTGVLSALDQQFASRLSRLYGEHSASCCWALAIASRQESAGHVCADLQRLSRVGLNAETPTGAVTYSALATAQTVEEWISELRTSSLVELEAALDTDSEREAEAAKPRPLVMDEQGRLYLRRSYRSEIRLAELIRARTEAADLEVDSELAGLGIRRLLPELNEDDPAPRIALETALARPLSIVTGGPGTGKTTLVARFVALLVEQALAKGDRAPRVRLLAPTGKAAAAMGAAFSLQRNALDLSDEILAAMEITAETVHRALFQHSRRRTLGRASDWTFEADVVVIDEASMVDLEWMTRLFSACRSVGRVVLLGDPSQLASVDSGAVLSELCEAPAEKAELGAGLSAPGPSEAYSPQTRPGSSAVASPGLRDSIVRLQRSHRYDDAGGIGRLAEAIRVGDEEAVIGILEDPLQPAVELCPIESISETRARLVRASRTIHQEIGGADTESDKLERLGLYRVLCAHRRGPLGAEALCAVLDEAAAAQRHTIRRSDWWSGRMLLVTQNAPDQNLWNGDVGLIEETTMGLRAIFPDGAGGVRVLSPGRLPAHESAIAMSVHKSQGSEFDVVDLVLGDVLSRVMTRELVYTGVTRARSKIRIHASESVLRDAIGRRVSRDSGLSDRVWAD